MTYRVPLPAGGRRDRLDVVDPFSTMIQRQLRRTGLASYEPETAAALLSLMEAQPDGFAFFDVGANVGLYASMCAAMFRPGAVHAFEPAPGTAAVARSIAAANGLDVAVHQVALSSSPGTATLHLSATSDASNSLAEGFKAEVGRVEVATRTLDEVVAEVGVAPDLIKLDVETHEPEVLAGGARTLREHRPLVVVEVLRRRGRDHGADVTAAFDGLGYRFVELSAAPTWATAGALVGSGTGARDWLAVPDDVDLVADLDLPAAWARWHARLEACGPERNQRLGVSTRLRMTWRRGGPSAVAAAVARRARDAVRS